MLDFICLGVPKCGTTTLFEILLQHRDIKLAETAHKNVYLGKKWEGDEFEKFYFKNTRKGKIKGFIAEDWYGKISAKNLADKFSKNLKIFFIVRNPVARSFSHYKWTYAYHGLKGLSQKEYYKYNHSVAFDRYVKRECKRSQLIDFGNYYKYLKEFYKVFGEKNVKIIIFEEFVDNIQKECESLFSFLGVRSNVSIVYNLKANEGIFIPKNKLLGILYGEIRTNFIFYKLYVKYRVEERSKFLNKIVSRIVQSFNYCLKPDYDRSGISNKTRKFLQAYYKKDKEAFEKLIEKDLKNIWF